MRCRDGARSVLLRLEGKRNAAVLGFITLLLLPPTSPAAYPEP